MKFDTQDSTVISSNSIKNCDSGINLNGATRTIISNNQIYGNATTTNLAYGIYNGSWSNMTGNYIRAMMIGISELSGSFIVGSNQIAGTATTGTSTTGQCGTTTPQYSVGICLNTNNGTTAVGNYIYHLGVGIAVPASDGSITATVTANGFNGVTTNTGTGY